jgi:phosphohistidine phosphatase
MNIILMRHGEAVPFAPNDGDRVLTPNGKGEASNTGTQLKKAGWIPQTVFCSTRIRAQQTSELVIGALGLAIKPQVLQGMTPEDDWAQAAAVIEENATDRSLFVFHQPILTQIVGHLTEANANADVHPRAAPATAYVLALETLLPGAATLVGAYQP